MMLSIRARDFAVDRREQLTVAPVLGEEAELHPAVDLLFARTHQPYDALPA